MTGSSRDDEDVVSVFVLQSCAYLECVRFNAPARRRKVGCRETDFHSANSFLLTSVRLFFSASISRIIWSDFLSSILLYDFVRSVGLAIFELGKSLCSKSSSFLTARSATNLSMVVPKVKTVFGRK
jgi:hypothetical protein